MSRRFRMTVKEAFLADSTLGCSPHGSVSTLDDFQAVEGGTQVPTSRTGVGLLPNERKNSTFWEMRPNVASWEEGILAFPMKWFTSDTDITLEDLFVSRHDSAGSLVQCLGSLQNLADDMVDDKRTDYQVNLVASTGAVSDFMLIYLVFRNANLGFGQQPAYWYGLDIITPLAAVQPALQQAPLVLASGSIMRMPARNRRTWRTRVVRFPDGSEQRTPDMGVAQRAVRMNLSLLRESERADWQEFLENQRGRLNNFFFVSPFENLLKWSERPGQALFTKTADVYIGQNEVLWSENAKQSEWTKNQCTVGDVGGQVGPDGNMTGQRLTPDGGATDAYIQQVVTFTKTSGPNTERRWTPWVKAASGTPSIDIEVRKDSDGLVLASVTAALTTSWQKFPVQFDSGNESAVRVRIGGSSTWVVAEGAIDWTFGQLIVGSEDLDYTKTEATKVELKIADPFWQQAPAGVTGASDGFNSSFPKRARQVVMQGQGANELAQLTSVTPGGSGGRRIKGLTIAGSVWVKDNVNSEGTYTAELVVRDSQDAESGTTGAIAPTSSWVRIKTSKQFSPGNGTNGVEWALKLDDTAGTRGSILVFGPQLNAGDPDAEYMMETKELCGIYSARLGSDTIEELTKIGDLFDFVEDITIEEAF